VLSQVAGASLREAGKISVCTPKQVYCDRGRVAHAGYTRRQHCEWYREWWRAPRRTEAHGSKSEEALRKAKESRQAELAGPISRKRRAIMVNAVGMRQYYPIRT